MSKNVTRKQAEAVLKVVEKKFAAELEGVPADSPERPHLYEPGFHSSGWTVAWEGHYEWTLSQFETSPKVFVEPVNGWCLGIYPA